MDIGKGKGRQEMNCYDCKWVRADVKYDGIVKLCAVHSLTERLAEALRDSRKLPDRQIDARLKEYDSAKGKS